jgi:hypothetical protein
MSSHLTYRRRVIALTSIGALALSLLTSGAQAGEVRGGSAPIVKEACDSTGDGDKDDCIRHGHHKGSSDHVLNGDDQLVVRAHAHPSLHNKTLRTEVQVRALNSAGKVTGPWTTQGTFVWNTTNDDGSAERKTFRVCAPEKTGLYQVRKKVTVPKTDSGDRSMRSGLRSSTTYTSSSTTVASNGPNCPPPDNAQDLVEYFNLVNFTEDFVIQIQNESSTTSYLWITCPEKGPSTPDYSLVLSTIDGSASSNCNSSTPLYLIYTSLSACSDLGEKCNFNVVYSDPVSGMVFSETEIVLEGKWTGVIAPDLDPATMPVCNNTLNKCLVTEGCSESSKQTGSIQLCESATGCNAPLTVTQPGLASPDQVTFVSTTPAVTSTTPVPTPSPSPSPTPSPVPSLSPSATPSPAPSPSSS